MKLSHCLPVPAPGPGMSVFQALPLLSQLTRGSLCSLPHWPVASILWFLACWPASVCQALLLQPAKLQVSSYQGRQGGAGAQGRHGEWEVLKTIPVLPFLSFLW